MPVTVNPLSELKVGHRQHKAAETVSALHHLSPTQGISFPVPRLHQGQKMWSQIEIQINYIERETCTCAPEIPRPGSPPWYYFKNSFCSTSPCPHCRLRPAVPGGNSLGRVHGNSTQIQPTEGEGRTHTFLFSLCVHLK